MVSRLFKIGLRDWIFRPLDWIFKLFGSDFADFGFLLATKSTHNPCQNDFQIKVETHQFCFVFRVEFDVFPNARNLKIRAAIETGAQFLQNRISGIR